MVNNNLVGIYKTILNHKSHNFLKQEDKDEKIISRSICRLLLI